MNKHTAGPWYADPGRRVTGFAITHDGEPNPLAICLRKPANSYSKGISDAKALANAHLIAAAPDLLEALEAMVFGAGAVAVHHEGERKALQMAVDIALAAIAKARGEA